MRKAFRHTGVLMMLGVVALGLIGAAYTLWFENLSLNATVETGIFNVDASIHGTALPVVSLDQGATYKNDVGLANATGEPVATIDQKMPTCMQAVATDNGTGQANDAADNNVLNLTLGNAYPYAGCHYSVDFHNVGTVPAHFALTGITLTEDGNPVTPAPWTITLDQSSALNPQCVTLLNAAAGQDGSGNPIALPYELPGIQLHQGDEVSCGFYLTLDQVANAEGHTYVYSATFTAHQWNETAP